VVDCDIDAVGVVLGGLVVLWFEAGLAKQALYLIDTSLQLDAFKIYFLESLQ
jgi:hypothetical protein